MEPLLHLGDVHYDEDLHVRRLCPLHQRLQCGTTQPKYDKEEAELLVPPIYRFGELCRRFPHPRRLLLCLDEHRSPLHLST